MMNFIEYLWGPIIGAAIGYFTNYIAVKMLFHPYKPVYMGKWKLPFTPGIIPKRKSDLAKAVGNAVGKKLFTSDDLKSMLMSEDVTDKIADNIIKRFKKTDTNVPDSAGSETINTSMEKFIGVTDTEKIKENLSGVLSNQLILAVKKMDLSSIMKEQISGILAEMQNSLGLLAMVLKGRMMDRIVSGLSEKLNTYIEEHGQEKAMPAVRAQIEELSNRPLHDLFDNADENVLRKLLTSAYLSVVSGFIDSVVANFDIATVVEEKVNGMSVKDLEGLCMSVMKNELDAVVNLGAVIGFVIGILNMLI